MVMAASFHSQFDVDGLDAGQRQVFRTALRLAAEKGGQVWIVEGGEVAGVLVLTDRLAEMAADQVRARER
jgi:hypothetical protein